MIPSQIADRKAKIREHAQKTDTAICDAAANARRFRMSIPPQPDDTDMLVTALCREDVPWLLEQLDQVQAREKRLREALGDVLAMIDEGWLGRDTSRDHEPDWAVRQMPYVQRLADAKRVIAAGGTA